MVIFDLDQKEFDTYLLARLFLRVIVENEII